MRSEFDLNLDVAGRCYSTAGGNVLQGITCNPSVAPTSATITYGFKPGVWAVAVSYAGGAGTTSSPVPSSRNPDSAVSSSIAGTITPAPSAPSNRQAGRQVSGSVVGSVDGWKVVRETASQTASNKVDTSRNCQEGMKTISWGCIGL